MKLHRWIKSLLVIVALMAPLVLSATAQAESGCHRNDTGPKGTNAVSGQSD